MDINPSVEIVLNRFEKVLDVQPLNEDGKKIIDDSQRFMHKEVNVVITTLIDKAHEENYLKDSQDNEIFITVSSSKQKVAKKISEEVKEYAAGEMNNSDIEGHVTAEGVTIEKRVLAREESISVGKFLLLEQLQQVSPDADIDEVKDKSVKDIMENIKKQKEKDKDKEKEKEKEKEEASDKDKVHNKQGNVDKKEDTVEVKKQNQVNQNNKKIEEEKNTRQKNNQDNKILPVEQKKQEKKDDTSQQPNVSLPLEKQTSKNDDIEEESAKKEDKQNEEKEKKADSKVREDLYNKDVEDQSETIGQGKAKSENEDKDSNKASRQNEDENKNENEDKKEKNKKD
jgi:hypothetical protein